MNLCAETFNALEQIVRFGEPGWFGLGDRDLATHLHRTRLLREGRGLAEVTAGIAGALGVAACIGLGNGAVFKLVPQYFPHDTGTVTGLVGALGGLGGFFPPLLLGLIKTQTGAYDLAFAHLWGFCLACLAVNYRVFLRGPNGGDRKAIGAVAP